jgi:hypothetical protein
MEGSGKAGNRSITAQLIYAAEAIISERNYTVIHRYF